MKVKVGIDPEHDMDAVAAIRGGARSGGRRSGSTPTWGGGRAGRRSRIIEALAPQCIHSVEQPLPADRIEDLAWLRERSPMPIMVDESVWGPDDARASSAPALPTSSTSTSARPAACAMPRGSSRWPRVAGIACTIGSMPELGIGTAAEMHLAVAMPELLGPSDVCGVLYNAESLIHETLPIENGLPASPIGPGLGVTLDEARLRALTSEARLNQNIGEVPK